MWLNTTSARVRSVAAAQNRAARSTAAYDRKSVGCGPSKGCSSSSDMVWLLVSTGSTAAPAAMAESILLYGDPVIPLP